MNEIWKRVASDDYLFWSFIFIFFIVLAIIAYLLLRGHIVLQKEFPYLSRKEKGKIEPNDIEGFGSLIVATLREIDDLEVARSFAKIASAIANTKNHPLLFAMMANKLGVNRVSFDLLSIGQATRRAWRSGKDIKRMFVEYMEALPKGYRYDTISRLAFWSPETIERPLDLLDANCDAVSRREVQIRRVFLVEGPFSALDEISKAILLAHLAKGDVLHTRIRILLSNSLESFDSLGNFGVCIDPSGQLPALLLDMRYKGDGTFSEMEVTTDPQKAADHIRRFRRAYGEGSIDLRTYIHGSNS